MAGMLVVLIVGSGIVVVLVGLWSGLGDNRREVTLLAAAVATTTVTSILGLAVGLWRYRTDRLEPLLPSSTEVDADRRVLLSTPRPIRVRGRRALLLSFPVIVLLTWTVSAVFEPGPDEPLAGWRWCLTALGAAALLVGASRGWRAAARPEAIADEVNRATPRPWNTRVRRELLRRLRHGPALKGDERAAAAVMAAGRQEDHFQADFLLAYSGGFLALAAPAADDLLAWLPCAIFGVMAVINQLVALHARHVQRLVSRAGLDGAEPRP